MLEAARRCNVVIYGASVRGSAGPDFLGRLSWMTGGSLFEVESIRELSTAFISIFDEFRSRYLLRYTPRGVSREGWHGIEVKVKGRRGAARVRSGYMAQLSFHSRLPDDREGGTGHTSPPSVAALAKWSSAPAMGPLRP